MKIHHVKPARADFIACLALALYALCHTGLAADAPLTLRDAINATLAANPQLKSYPLRAAALDGERVTAAMRPPLQLNANLEDAFGTGAVRTLSRAELTLSLSQVVELGDQHEARVEVVGRRSALLRAEQRITELDLLADTTRRFIAVAAAQEQVALQRRAVVMAQETVDALVPLVAAGQSPAAEQARATAALARATLALAQASTDFDTARLALAAMWASLTPEFTRVTASLRDPGDAGDVTALLIGLDDNPDLQLFADSERLQQAELAVARSQQRGTVQWNAGIRHLREAGDTGLVVGASMPLGSRERAAGAIASAQAALDAVAIDRAIALNSLRTMLQTLHARLRQAILEVNTLRDVVLPALDSAQQQTRAAYLGGRYSYIELVSAQAEYLAAERALIDAATDAHMLRADIERLTGTALNSAETQP
jgi:cobalt-zinc-cadmium efflux system outer membrane protein